ncbi:MAG: glycosyltransferase family 2 protein [Gemmatimonadetes bacterium]|nr:glycosyltransferase family 2 protein [Gemmatimonadota bacterium]MYG86195.1 glycosyltransferase family 2 protein [Gemmatimonadota bacterium]MYJ90305.1 glycosyltransferase family 2 protein [Gemmatimonadota bacterium]
MTYLSLLESVVLAGSVVLVAYGFLLSFIGRIRGSGKVPLIFPRHVFALVVPVGNDEGTIGRTVEHLRRNKYPRSMFDVIVAPLNCTDQTPTIARRKGAVVYGPGKQRWTDADDAVHGVLERLSTKDRYDAYVVLDVRSRISPNFLAVMSDKLSRGALAVQSGYSVTGRKWTWNTASRALLSALKPCWLTSWPLNLRLAGGIHRTGLCVSRRLVEKHGVKRPRLDNVLGFLTKLLRHDVVIQYTDQAWVYDRTRALKPVRSTFDRLRSRWKLARTDGLPLIMDGLKWRSAAQVIGGFNLFMPSFNTTLLTALLFFGLAVYLNGVASAIALGWIALIAGLAIFVVFRLWFMRAPVLAYAALPSLPLILFWQAVRSCFASSPKPPPAKAETKDKVQPESGSGRTQGRRPRRRYSRRPRRQPS